MKDKDAEILELNTAMEAALENIEYLYKELSEERDWGHKRNHDALVFQGQLATAQAQLAEGQKDAERLDFMIEHTDSVFKTGDGRYVVEYSVNEFNYHAYAATSREAIDAAIEAEGRKE